jgi:hypothetical protein
MGSTNQFKNVLGIYPRGWRLPLEFRRERAKKEILVRLMGVQRKVIGDDGLPSGEDPDVPMPRPKMPGPKEPGQPPKVEAMKKQPAVGPGAKFYEAKEGFANYYFNRKEKERLLAGFHKSSGDFKKEAGAWSIEGSVRLKKLRTESNARFDLKDEKTDEGVLPVVQLKIDNFPYKVEPLKPFQESAALRQPDSSGGLLAAVYLWHRLLTLGEKGFSEAYHGGREPIYPPPADGTPVKSLASLRTDAEVLITRHGPFAAKWYFSPTDQKLLSMEMQLRSDEDPCELYFYDYRPVADGSLPHRLTVQYGDLHYGTFTLNRFEMAQK